MQGWCGAGHCPYPLLPPHSEGGMPWLRPPSSVHTWLHPSSAPLTPHDLGQAAPLPQFPPKGPLGSRRDMGGRRGELVASSKPHKVSSGMEVCCVPPTLCSLRAAWVGGSLLPLYSPLAHMDGQTVTPAQLPPISPRPGRTHHPVMGPLHSLGCTGLAPPADSSPHQSTPSLIFTAIAAPGPDTGGATPTAGHQRDPNGGGGRGHDPHRDRTGGA